MGFKTLLRESIQKLTGVRYFRYSLPRGVDFIHDVRHILPASDVATVFDVGANVGQSADWFYRVFPDSKIWCFEPVTKTYLELQRTVASWKNVDAFQIAFGEVAEIKTIYLNASPVSSENSFIRKTADQSEEVVSVQKIDEFCALNDVQKIDLLKIDVEGFELAVLRGAEKMLQEKRIKALYLESAPRVSAHSSFVILHELDEYLFQFGYEIFGIYDQQADVERKLDHLYFFNVAFVQRELCHQR